MGFIIFTIINHILFFNLLFIVFIFLIIGLLPLASALGINTDFPQVLINILPLLILFSIFNWILKPIILIKTYKFIKEKYPEDEISLILKKIKKHKSYQIKFLFFTFFFEILWILICSANYSPSPSKPSAVF